MLEPHSRKLLLESLAPPPEHRLDWAVGTTYSLDLIALLAAPVAFAFSDWQDRQGNPLLEPLSLLKATRQYAHRILLFCQPGRIHVPRGYQPLLANLEGSIAEAFAPRGGSFHAKIWFLRYLGPDETVTYRLLCLSRNMTFDRSWDTMLCLEGPLSERANAFARNHPLGEFVESLPTMLRRGLVLNWRKRIETLAYELRRVDFILPEQFEDLRYWPIGIGEGDDWPFDDCIDRMLVISPFVDAGFVNKVAPYSAPLELVSRPESLDCLPPAELSRFEQVYTLDETAQPEHEDPTATPSFQASESDGPAKSRHGNPTPVPPLLGLHAKCYLADAGWNSRIWTGSANATGAAFSRNVEFLIELRGKKSRYGIAAVMGRAADNDHKHVACLGDLLIPFVKAPETPVPQPAQVLFDRQADELAKQIAMRAAVAHCEKCDADQYALVVRPTKRGRVSPPMGSALRVWPISLGPNHSTSVSFDDDEWCSFAPVSLIALTSFFAWELVSADGQFSRQFVLCLPLENAPADRSDYILRHLLVDRQSVLRFLLLLLIDPNEGDIASLFTTPTQNGVFGVFGDSLGATLLESLLRAIDRRPDQIDEVEQIVQDLEKSAEGRRLLPEGFHDVWKPIIDARRKRRSKTSRN
jgi:hypothetical protein